MPKMKIHRVKGGGDLAGRPRKKVELSTGKIGKDKIKSRKEIEEKLRLERNELLVPEWMNEDPIAKGEFLRVVKEAGKINLLDNLDLSVVAIYAKAYSNYVKATIIIDKDGMTVLDSNAVEKVSPYVTAQEKYVKQIFSCSTKLGLATTDRLKLVVPTNTENEVNKFLKYLS